MIETKLLIIPIVGENSQVVDGVINFTAAAARLPMRTYERLRSEGFHPVVCAANSSKMIVILERDSALSSAKPSKITVR